jgi:hypothetical protein
MNVKSRHHLRADDVDEIETPAKVAQAQTSQTSNADAAKTATPKPITPQSLLRTGAD